MFRRITVSCQPTLSRIKLLYENTFPLHERRTWEALVTLLAAPEMFLNCIIDSDQFIGFIIYWKLEEWLYIEHLAIEPALRSWGYGSKAIRYLSAHEIGKLVVETEPRHNEEACRRIRFYEKLGLQLVDHPYMQPPYRKEEEPVPMKLMATQCIEIKEFGQLADLIRCEIYERFY